MNKYKAIKVNGVKIDEHRHVMQQHIGRKLTRNEIVHHKDGDKLNNDISNLEILSRSEHTRMHMLEFSSEESYVEQLRLRSKISQQKMFKKHTLNRDQVREIKSLIGKLGVSKIAEMYNVHRCSISRIKNNIAWV
jgi:hypothetical protein